HCVRLARLQRAQRRRLPPSRSVRGVCADQLLGSLSTFGIRRGSTVGRICEVRPGGRGQTTPACRSPAERGHHLRRSPTNAALYRCENAVSKKDSRVKTSRAPP